LGLPSEQRLGSYAQIFINEIFSLKIKASDPTRCGQEERQNQVATKPGLLLQIKMRNQTERYAICTQFSKLEYTILWPGEQ
jgi:hypothetical protein